jgi:hypothetical protein
VAVVAAVKTGELLHEAVRESEGGSSDCYLPPADGAQRVVCRPPERLAPMNEARPVVEEQEFRPNKSSGLLRHPPPPALRNPAMSIVLL